MSPLVRRLGVALASLTAVLVLLGGSVATEANAGPSLVHPLCPAGGLCGGLVIVPDDRFDPLVQNLLAKRELGALPTDFYPLFIWMPTTEDPALVEHQIRFLHQLLKESERSGE